MSTSYLAGAKYGDGPTASYIIANISTGGVFKLHYVFNLRPFVCRDDVWLSCWWRFSLTIYLMFCFCVAISATSGGSAAASTASGSSGGSNSSALRPQAGGSVVFALLLALISGFLVVY